MGLLIIIIIIFYKKKKGYGGKYLRVRRAVSLALINYVCFVIITSY